MATKKKVLILALMLIQAFWGFSQVKNNLGMDMKEIPKGKFYMGSNGRGNPFWPSVIHGENYDEAPIHKVTISKPFLMSATEVTNLQYEQFDPGHAKMRGDHGFSIKDNEAVVSVSYYDAMAFCQWLSKKEGKTYRLPTEAEWEYACRAGSFTAYSMNDALPGVYQKKQEHGFLSDQSGAFISKNESLVDLTVAKTPVNPLGLFDMHGNVEEWCLDWHGPYSANAQQNSAGPAEGEFKVTRGGSHSTPLQYLRSANRSAMIPEDKSWMVGFRVVCAEYPPTIPPQPKNPTETNINISQGKFKWNKPSQKPFFEEPLSFVNTPDLNSKVPFYFHNHVPSITYCDNGDLLAIWLSTDDERGREMLIYGSRLPANKKQWSAPQLFYKVPDRNMASPQLFNDGKGNLIHMNGVSAAGTESNQTIIIRQSNDNGATWSRSKLITEQHGGWHVPVTGLIKTSQGWLIQQTERGISNGGGSTIIISKDQGKTWSDPGSGSPDPSKYAEFFYEGGTGGRIAGIHAVVTELANGNLLALGRCDNIKNKEGIDRMPMSISEDGGKTWKYAASEFPPIDGGQRMVLKRLKEGPLLLISFTNHPYRLKNNLKGMTFTATDGSEFTGYGMYAALSFDEGKSWPVKKLLTDGKERFLDGGAWTGYFEMNATNAEPRGYLGMIQTPDNLINLVSSKNHYQFNLAWLLDNPAFKKYVAFIR